MSGEADPGPRPRRKRFDLGTKVLIGLLAGVACGLFFGEYCAGLGIVGEIFVGLLQMTVLPYIAVAIIANIGRMPMERGGRLVIAGVTALVVLWVIGLIVLMVMPLSFPERTTASFFSVSSVTTPESPDYLGLFVPSNIFRSLATNAVPGVVLFCILVGVALIGVHPKDALLQQLDALSGALARVNGYVVRLTPLGVFAMAASAAGTLSLEEIGRLRAYLITYTAATVLLAFVILPTLISAVTPFRYREIMRATRTALITAFATAKVLVVLPMLIEGTKELFRERRLDHDEVEPTIDLAYPLAYPFPTLGKVLALLFVPFTAWFVGARLDLIEQLGLMVSGLFSMFGGPIITIPLLLDAAELPSDMFHLFMLSGVYTSRLGDLLGVMHLAAIAIVTTCAVAGYLRVRWSRVVVSGVLSVVLLTAIVVATRTWLKRFEDPYEQSKILASMQLVDDKVPVVVLDEPAPNPVPLAPGQSRLTRIRERGVIRIGFNENNVPFTFFSQRGDLVGFDIEMAHQLADDLGVSIEFVPVTTEKMADQLDADHCDLVMAGLIGTLNRSERMSLSDPYMDVHMGLIVRDHDRERFESMQAILEAGSPAFGMAMEKKMVDLAREKLDYVEIVHLDSPQDFFEGRTDLEGVIMSAEAGSAWTIRYPGFHVVNPFTRSLPLNYPLGSPDERFESYINHWIGLVGRGKLPRFYDHWILGKTATESGPRWCIARDVLHWIN
jgi:Na+/H+-dicarboxylate symporter